MSSELLTAGERAVATVAALLEATLDARAHQELGDECARLALALADRARAHWAAARACLDDAEKVARELASQSSEDDAWPRGLETSILRELDERNEREAAA